MSDESKFEHAGFRVRIEQDSDAEPPSQDEEVFIVTTRNRYFQLEQAGFEMNDIRDGKHKRAYHCGFYGFDYCVSEAKTAAEYARKHEDSERAKIDRAMHV